jgi:RimJ/RimL family protein N-acetyltransferase
MPLSAPVLTGARVRLEPLALQHIDGLVAAAAENRETYDYTRVPTTREDAVAMVEEQLALHAQGEVVPFVQVVGDRVAGMTRFLAVRCHPGQELPFAVEIGGTWLAASVQRTGVNVESKLLLLAHAFGVWDVARVDWRSDARNARSRTAILALGATFEGVLRQWQASHVKGEEGLLRDSAIFSVLASEWPAVKLRLEGRLAR